MAHFAKIENGIVTQVIVVGNDQLQGKDFPESEKIGQQFIESINLPGEWLQASYNKNFRSNFPSRGYTYNKKLDAFVPPKPYPSWVLDESIANWKAPVPIPKTNRYYTWNENELKWEVEPDYDVR